MLIGIERKEILARNQTPYRRRRRRFCLSILNIVTFILHILFVSITFNKTLGKN